MSFRFSSITVAIFASLASSLAVGCAPEDGSNVDSASDDVTASKAAKLTCTQAAEGNATLIEPVVVTDLGEVAFADVPEEHRKSMARETLQRGFKVKKYRVVTRLTTSDGKPRSIDETYWGNLFSASESRAGNGGTIRSTESSLAGADANTHGTTLFHVRTTEASADIALDCKGALPSEAVARGLNPKKNRTFAFHCYAGGEVMGHAWFIATNLGASTLKAVASRYTEDYAPRFVSGEAQLLPLKTVQAAGDKIVVFNGESLASSTLVLTLPMPSAPTDDLSGTVEGDFGASSKARCQAELIE